MTSRSLARVWGWAALGLLLMAASCGGSPPAVRPPAAPATPAVTTLETLAREIDPGDVEGVATSLHIQPAAAAGTADERLARARKSIDEILVLVKDGRFDHTSEQARMYLTSIAEAEHLAATDGPARAHACGTLLEGYGLLSGIFVARHYGEQIAQLSAAKASLSADAKRDLGIVARSTVLRRRAAACVLRSGGTPEEIAAALEAAGRHFADQGDAARARELHEQAMARRGEDKATSIDWSRLAASRAAALAHVEARAALDRARKIEDRLNAIDRRAYTVAAARTERQIAAATAAAKLFGSKQREDEIAFALLLVDLRPAPAVRPLMEALAKKYPDDARPHAALARFRLEDDAFDPEVLRAAEAIIEQAAAGKNQTLEYWDVAMAFAAKDFTQVISTPARSREEMIGRVKEAWARVMSVAKGFAELDRPRSEALGLVSELFRIAFDATIEAPEERVAAMLASKAASFEALAGRHPGSPDVTRALMIIGFMNGTAASGDPTRAFRLLGRDIAEAAREDSSLVVEQLRLYATLAARRGVQMPEIDALLAKAKASTDRPRRQGALQVIEGDYLSARSRTENKPELAVRSMALYTTALETVGAEDRDRTVANLAVLRYASGARSQTKEQLTSVATGRPPAQMVELNLAILAALEKDAGASKMLETFGADDSKRTEARATALSWVARLARDRGDLARARAAAKESLDVSQGKIPLERGLLFELDMSFGVSYAPAAPRLHRVQLDLKHDQWLVLARAMPDVELKGLAKAAPRAPARALPKKQ